MRNIIVRIFMPKRWLAREIRRRVSVHAYEYFSAYQKGKQSREVFEAADDVANNVCDFLAKYVK